MFSTSLVATILLGTSVFAQSQSGDSLGDVARANRANQQAQESVGATPKVITNQDLPANPPGVLQASTSDPMTTVSGVTKSDSYPVQPLNRRQMGGQRSYPDQPLSHRQMGGQRGGEQQKERIQNQENRIENLQARIDRMNASMHTNGGTAQYEGPGNRSQAIQMQRLAMMQDMLARQKRILEMMQDADRRSGVNQ
jgi:hypothetical protein